MPTLQDEIVTVTGASQGLGEQVVKAYADAGAAVVLVARHQKRLEKVHDAIAASGGLESFAICFDLMGVEESELAQFVIAVDGATGSRLDDIVYCVSYFYSLSLLDFQTVVEWVSQYHINTVTSMDPTRTFAPMLETLPGASVILVSKSHSEAPQAYQGGFGAFKVALNYLCKVTAGEWERLPNLRANVLIPSPINSSQRIRSHPGGPRTECKNYHDILSQFVRWISEESKGHTGKIVYLQPICRPHLHRQRNQI